MWGIDMWKRRWKCFVNSSVLVLFILIGVWHPVETSPGFPSPMYWFREWGTVTWWWQMCSHSSGRSPVPSLYLTSLAISPGSSYCILILSPHGLSTLTLSIFVNFPTLLHFGLWMNDGRSHGFLQFDCKDRTWRSFYSYSHSVRLTCSSGVGVEGWLKSCPTLALLCKALSTGYVSPLVSSPGSSEALSLSLSGILSAWTHIDY